MLTFFEMVGQRILEQIEQKNWTQQKLADELKVSKQVLNKIVKGEKNTSILEIRQIADILNVPIQELLEPINEIKYSTDVEEEVFPMFMGSVETDAGKEGMKKGFQIINMLLEYEETLDSTRELYNQPSSIKNMTKRRNFTPEI
jgi:transcriptional regulator with XRE-family HTH domain